jgi:hypothetical protein
MARKQYGIKVGKIFAAVALLVVTVIGVGYGSLLRGMDQAADEYSRGDVEAALSRYESIDQRLQSLGAMRVIPTEDRRNLILNQARLLYALGRLDDAQARMDREAEISGTTSNDARYLLLKGDIAFRKAEQNYRESDSKDPRLLEEALRGAEDYLGDSLRLSPDDWDAKYNFEYINYLRRLLTGDNQGRIRILMEDVRVKEMPPQTLPPDASH